MLQFRSSALTRCDVPCAPHSLGASGVHCLEHIDGGAMPTSPQHRRASTQCNHHYPIGAGGYPLGVQGELRALDQAEGGGFEKEEEEATLKTYILDLRVLGLGLRCQRRRVLLLHGLHLPLRLDRSHDLIAVRACSFRRRRRRQLRQQQLSSALASASATRTAEELRWQHRLYANRLPV